MNTFKKPMTTYFIGMEDRGSQENFRARRLAFRTLHEAGCFVIPNPWDVGSARYLQNAFQTICEQAADYELSARAQLPLWRHRARRLAESHSTQRLAPKSAAAMRAFDHLLEITKLSQADLK